VQGDRLGAAEERQGPAPRPWHIAKRRGTKIATIAISRKLLTRAWHLLSEMQAADASTPSRRP